MVEGKINIKIGNFEVGYEGSEEYIKNDFLSTVEQIKDMFCIDDTQINSIDTQIKTDQGDYLNQQIQGTVGNIAAKIGVSSGPDLVLDTAAYLYYVEKRESFSRQDILVNMKKSTSYYKQSYRGNLSPILNTLVKKDLLNEIREDTYALSPNGIQEIENKLANQAELS